MYNFEKDKIMRNHYDRKGWYLGDLQRQMRKSTMEFSPTMLGDDGLFDGHKYWLDCLQSELTLLEKRYDGIIAKKDVAKYMWIGINPKFDSMDQLYNKLKTLPLGNYTATVEGYTKEGYRPHIHMLLITNHKPYRIIDKLASHFNCEKNFIQAKNMTKYYDEKMNYLKGNKIDEKKEFVEKDIKERDESGIPHIIFKS